VVFTVKIKAARSFETLVSYYIPARRHNPRDHEAKFHPEDGSDKVLRNTDTLPHLYTTPKTTI
jgi:hypothetical protein